METISIKPLKIKASRICLGTWAIGGWMWGGSNEVDSINTVIYALENGINTIDTAPVYGFGVAEDIVGKAVQKHGHRDKIIIATKVGLAWQDGKVYRNATPQRIRQEIEDSLTRLRTDYIDIYQIHWPDPLTPIEETAKTMLALLNEGKIRAIGVSNFSIPQMESFMQVAPIHTSQPPYNLFERQIESTLLPFTEKHKIATLAYGALCRGLLTGKMRLDTIFTKDDIRHVDPKFKAPRYEQYLDAVAALSKFSNHEYEKSVLALAVRWILDRGHTIALWGARHPEQLRAIDEVMDWKLDAEAMKHIDAILNEHIKDPIGPEFMAPPERKKE
jgi:aryl-alcohol dehydrogenase-like predicted oxidoreductase